jgi:hypothetical protein
MLNITFDPITKIPYYYVSNKEQLNLFSKKINKDNLLIGLYANETRFLTNNNTLVKFTCSDIIKTYNLLDINATQRIGNSVSFDLGSGHAFIKFKCTNCDKGKEHNKTYGLVDKVIVHNGTSYQQPEIPLKFYLTDSQAINVFNALYHFQQDLSYKYTRDIRDCVAFLNDVALKSGLGNFANYYADYELIEEVSPELFDNKFTAFSNKHFTCNIDEVSNRKEVGLYMENTYGELFRSNWDILKYTIINISSIPKNSFISSRINDIKETFFNFLISSDIESDTAKKLSEVFINENLDNEDLYFYQSYNYSIDMIKHSKKSGFYSQIKNKLTASKEEFIEHFCKNSQMEICKELLSGIDKSSETDLNIT